MGNKVVYICGKDQISSRLAWILKEFRRGIVLKLYETAEKLNKDLENGVLSNLLILDTAVLKRPVCEFAVEFHKQRPSLNTVLVVYPSTKKDDIMEVIKTSAVQGIIVAPFTGEIVCKYVDRLMGRIQ
ncbi:MAG: hypothetical protein CSYNP_01830 [Syntrophus sp. SKADARSKE-3]|nr:hypothetical protein [Syntrophus sp. SKADARSKE-3]